METPEQKYIDLIYEKVYSDTSPEQVMQAAWLMSQLCDYWQKEIDIICLDDCIGFEWRHPQWRERNEVYVAATAQCRGDKITGIIFGKQPNKVYIAEISEISLPFFLELTEYALSL